MAEERGGEPVIEPLRRHHDRAAFSCGVAELDRYLHRQAGQDARRLIAAPFVLVMPDNSVGGFYTLSAASVAVSEVPEAVARRLPRYPQIPSFLLGRLAVDRRYQGQGWGRVLLVDALRRCARSEIPGFAVIVDAIDENARQFYLREGFLRLPNSPNRLFRSLAGIAAALRDFERGE